MNRPDPLPDETTILPDGTKLIRIVPGQRVICDGGCGEEYTDRPDSGGILFQSKAICPKCAPPMERDAKAYGEERFIRGRCPEGKSFADWVREDLR